MDGPGRSYKGETMHLMQYSVKRNMQITSLLRTSNATEQLGKCRINATLEQQDHLRDIYWLLEDARYSIASSSLRTFTLANTSSQGKCRVLRGCIGYQSSVCHNMVLSGYVRDSQASIDGLYLMMNQVVLL